MRRNKKYMENDKRILKSRREKEKGGKRIPLGDSEDETHLV
jgi:hypothetical protein